MENYDYLSTCGKFVTFNGLRFCRDDKTGYYLCTPRGTNKPVRIHRVVWEFFNGQKIPRGFQIHHVDFDKRNNHPDNLILMSKRKHLECHGEHPTEKQIAYRKNNRDRFLKKSAEWHRSEEGREWHRQHVKNDCQRMHEKVSHKCKQCGNVYTTTKNGKFCSNKCKAKWRRDNGLDDETRICKRCNHEFRVNKYSKTEYCSRQCAAEATGENRRKKKSS